MKTVSIKMTWVGEAKEVAVGGEFNGWAPVPLSCQQVNKWQLKCLDVNISIFGIYPPGVYFRERLGLSTLMWSQDAIHTGLSFSIEQTIRYFVKVLG